MAMRFRRLFKEELLFFIFLLALFLTITVLVLVLLSGRSRRENLLLEYEAQRIAAALMEATRDGFDLDIESLEQRVVGFGIYTSQGAALQRFGSAPPFLPVPSGLGERAPVQAPVVRFHEERKTLTLIRWIGMFPGMMEMHRRMPRAMRPENLQLLFLELTVEDYWSARRTVKSARFLAPLLILFVLGLVGFLYHKNSLYRRKLASQQQLAQLGEASRTLSHEIKNPLSAIRIQTGILRKTLPETNRDDLRIIDEEVSRLSLLTDRIGDFLKDPLGQPEPIKLDSFVREMILRWNRPIAYTNEVDPDVEIHFDRQRLRSVLENLLNNALESQQSTSEAPPVLIIVSASKSRVDIAVFDQGEGIPEAAGEKIFDPFYTSKINGSGVGLSICKRFVEAAGGDLTVQNRKGGGTEARIVLPRGHPARGRPSRGHQ
ncbi:MAG: HAMP domain-containing histidine kinase [Spirochaetaceae bacterium]|nr:MAG: HAMP domain-containing histidine kinase [Spirochaetaceae bacterium]